MATAVDYQPVSAPWVRTAGEVAVRDDWIFPLSEAANNWIGNSTGKTSSEIVRWMEHMAGMEIRK